jgi:ABC-type branched-subunit amino acid transport system substrate-binding protein
MVLTAMTKIKKVSRRNITAELKKLTYKGLTKTIKFSASGDVSALGVYVYKVNVTTSATGYSSSISQIASTKP